MPVLPDASDIRRRQPSATRGVVGFNADAGAMSRAGAVIGQEADRLHRTAELKRENTERAWLAKATAEARLEWTRKAIERERETDDPTNYATKFRAEFDDYAAKSLSNAPDGVREAFDARLTQLASGLQSDAMRFENKRYSDRAKLDADGVVSTNVNAVRSNPLEYEATVKQTAEDLENLRPFLGETGVETRARDANSALAAAHLQARIDAGDHDGVLGELTDGKWDARLGVKAKDAVLSELDRARKLEQSERAEALLSGDPKELLLGIKKGEFNALTPRTRRVYGSLAESSLGAQAMENFRRSLASGEPPGGLIADAAGADSLGARQNNPGNLRKVPGQKWQGEVTGGGEFAKFETPEAGVRAMAVTLRNYQDRHGLKTIEDIVTRYAPPSENNTAAYVGRVADAVGVSPTDEIDLNDATTLKKVMTAMIGHELGGVPYKEGVIDRGIAAAGGLTPLRQGGAPLKSTAGRQLYLSDDGEFVSEKSVTIRLPDGRWLNAPSIYGGRRYSSEDEILGIVSKNGYKDPDTGRALEFFPDLESAEAAARERSASLIDEKTDRMARDAAERDLNAKYPEGSEYWTASERSAAARMEAKAMEAAAEAARLIKRVEAAENGTAPFVQANAQDKKDRDALWGQFAEAADIGDADMPNFALSATAFAARYGSAPTQAVERINQGLMSDDPDTAAQAVEAAFTIGGQDETFYDRLGTKQEAFARYAVQLQRGGMDRRKAVESARAAVFPENPAALEERENRLKAGGKDSIIKAARVAAAEHFDVAEDDPTIDGMMADFAPTFRAAFIATGDAETAQEQAQASVGRIWGKSEVGRGGMVRYPPERVFKALGDSDGDWMNRQLVSEVAAAIGADLASVSAEWTPARDGAALTVPGEGAIDALRERITLTPVIPPGRRQPVAYQVFLDGEPVMGFAEGGGAALTTGPLAWAPDYSLTREAGEARRRIEERAAGQAGEVKRGQAEKARRERARRVLDDVTGRRPDVDSQMTARSPTPGDARRSRVDGAAPSAPANAQESSVPSIRATDLGGDLSELFPDEPDYNVRRAGLDYLISKPLYKDSDFHNTFNPKLKKAAGGRWVIELNGGDASVYLPKNNTYGAIDFIAGELLPLGKGLNGIKSISVPENWKETGRYAVN